MTLRLVDSPFILLLGIALVSQYLLVAIEGNAVDEIKHNDLIRGDYAPHCIEMEQRDGTCPSLLGGSNSAEVKEEEQEVWEEELHEFDGASSEDWDENDDESNDEEVDEDEDNSDDSDDLEVDLDRVGNDELRGSMTASELWWNLGCEEIFKSPRPIHSKEIWANMRSVYVNTVGVEKSSIITSNENETGFHKEITAKQSEGKGRGVFAGEFIAKGELVWSSSHTARFDSGELYRQFLLSIPVDQACDVLQWAYVQNMSSISEDRELQEDGIRSLRISCDLDDGSFMNADEDEPNIGCQEKEERLSGLGLNCVAIRDIQVGEELLTSYGDFALADGWAEFGL